jgi:imidazolonepropionase
MAGKKPCDLIVKNAGQLLTLKAATDGPRRGPLMSDLGLISGGSVAVRDGEIVAADRADVVERAVEVATGTLVIDARGKVVMPGFVDPHTHVVYCGSRVDEFEARLLGKTYKEIAQEGGGINATVNRVRRAERDELVDESLPRLERMLEWGTTTLEAKSGYGLTTDDEIKMLLAIRDLDGMQPIQLVPTFMGAHQIPPEYARERGKYIDLVVDEMIPEVVERELAGFCDVFCEPGFFSTDEAERILRAGIEAGLAPKLHADEFSSSGGAQLAAKIGAVSADHLAAPSGDGLIALSKTDCVAVLLPGTSFLLGEHKYAPAKGMIELGIPVALGTDCNPGSSPIEAMTLSIGLGCVLLGLTPAQAVCAATINAAHAVGLGGSVGSLEVGKQADMLILDVADYRLLAYHFATNHVQTVIKRGGIAHHKHS